MIARFLAGLDRHAAPVLAGSLLIGVLIPPAAAAAAPLLAPATLVLLASTLLRLDWGRLGASLAAPARAAALTLWLMLGCPFAAAALIGLLGLPREIAQPMLLFAASSMLMSVPAFALMSGLDAERAMVAMVASTALMPVTLPPIAGLLLDVALPLSVGGLAVRLAAFVGGAFAVAFAVRAALGPARIARAARPIGGVTVATMVVFAVGAMEGFTATLLEHPGRVLAFVAGAFGASFALQALGAAAYAASGLARPVARREVLTAALATGSRNLAVVVAVLSGAAGPDLLLFFASMQFPIFLTPALVLPFYRRAMARGACVSSAGGS